jgi:hypothetical protein
VNFANHARGLLYATVALGLYLFFAWAINVVLTCADMARYGVSIGPLMCGG